MNDTATELLPAVREQSGLPARLSVNELEANLDFIRQVMQNVMKEGQDFGKIPGAGEKPTLLQPGAQKLLMTFQLTDHVKSEVVTPIPHSIAGHREYSFVLTVRSQTGREWDGVGTCSTMESKYRYRGGSRKCPKCGQPTIIKGKAQYGGGWICFQKKGGCGAKFGDDDKAITSQSVEKQENPDPCDTWNTVRKMAFKRALVHAAINATNTSELWTQDLEDIYQRQTASEGSESFDDAEPSQDRVSTPKQAEKANSAPNPATPEVAKTRQASSKTMEWMLKELKAGPSAENETTVTKYFVGIDALMPNETLADLPLNFVPTSKEELLKLSMAIMDFSQGDPARRVIDHNPIAEQAEQEKRRLTPAEQRLNEMKEEEKESEEWRSFPMPWGKQAGTALEDLDKKYLYGLWCNYEVETEYNGKPKKPETIAKDRKFRELLDRAGEHYNFERKD